MKHLYSSFYRTTVSLLQLVLLLVFIGIGFPKNLQAQSIRSGVTFNWADTQSSVSDPANLQSILINGFDYNTFVVPSSYELTRLGPGGHAFNNIRLNGSQVIGASNDPNWNTEAITAFQSLNLNHYFQADNNGDNICGDFSAIATTDAQIQTIRYNPGIPSNPDGVIAVTERGGNNCFFIELFGIPVGGGPEQLLGAAFSESSGNMVGVQPQAPPQPNSDYWASGRNNDNNQVIGIALFEISSLAPTGSIITSIRFYAATQDPGDGKFFIMQTYAVGDIFNPDFETTFVEDVSTNDNIPVGSTYTLHDAPTNGSVTVNTDGTFEYTPNPGFTGTDTFDIQVCLPAPNQAVCDISTVTLNVKSGVTIDNASATEGDDLTFTIAINNPINQDIDFNINYTNNSTTNADYTGPATVTLPANASNVNFNVTALTDNLLENTETFNVVISNAANTVTIVDDTGLGTILDNDAPGAGDGISVSDFTVNESAGTANFTVSYTGPDVADAFTVDFAVADGSATDPDDYTVATAGTSVSFPAGTSDGDTQNVTINIVDDLLLEGDEDLSIALSNITNPLVNMVDANGVGTITDNEAPGAGDGISVSDFTVNESAGTANFTVSYTGPDVADAFTVDFAVADGSANDPDDYTVATAGTSVSFPAGTSGGDTQLVTINIVDDLLLEGDEDLSIALSNITNPLVNMVDANGVGTITDNEAPGAGDGISVSDFTVNESAGTANFTVSYTGPDVADAFTVDFAVADGSATDPDDYTVATAGTSVSFPAGTSGGDTQLVTINIVDDLLLEGDEDLSIALSNITNPLVNMVDANGVGTILDNDAPGAGDGISVSDFTVNESAGTANFTVSYTGPDVADAFTVDFAVADGSATDPDDYTVATAGTSVSFPAGTSDGDTQNVTINIVDDLLLEGDEDLSIALSNITNPLVNMVDANGVGTITDNEAPGAGDGISVSDFTVNESAGTANFTVSYTGPDVADAFTVDFAVADGSANDPDDYTVATAGTSVSFPAGTSGGDTQLVTINIVDDLLLEGDEDLSIALSNITNPLVNMVDANGVGTITDNEAPGAGDGISVSDFTVNESAGTANFTVSYTGPDVADAFTVDFAVADGSANDPDDYTVATAGTSVSFPAGTSGGDTQNVTINIVDDLLLEGDEDLSIALSNITNPLVNMVDANGVGTILDNDAPGAGDGISVSDFTVNESAGTANFTVSYTGPDVADAFTVDFAVADGSATDPDDYTVATAGTSVSFPAGTSDGDTQNVTINIVDDLLLEGDEDLSIALSNITNPLVNMVDANGVGTITDNEAPGAGDGISVSDFTVNESAGTANFTVSYTGPDVADAFTVDFAVADGSATDPDDYTVATAGTSVSFPAGTSDGDTQNVTINIVDDLLLEGDEDLSIALSNITNPLVNMVDANGVGTITDNEAPGAGDGISVSDFTVNESAGTANFTVSYTGPDVADAFTVDFAVADGSATDPDDYTVATAGTSVSFPAGTSGGDTQLVTINIVDDALLEGDEDLSIALSNITNPLVNMVDANGVGTITDNEAPGAGDGISVSDFTVNESAGTANFTVSYTGPDVADAFTVDFAVADGSANDPDDYTVATAGTSVSFPAGTSGGDTQLVTINIVDDLLLEGDEDLSITLSNITNPLVNMVDANGVGTITDNEAPGAGDGISVSDFTVNESAGTANFTVSYTGPDVADAFTVDFAVADGSATDPDDYTVATAGTSVSFPAGTSGGDTQLVTINIVDDALLEGDEDLSIALSNITNPLVNMVDANGTGTITDNEAPGAGDGISVSDFTVNESAGTANFTVSYTGPDVADAFTVDFAVADGSATDPDDYTVATAGTSVSFPAGTSDGDTQLVTINIVDDALLEGDEDLSITLSNITNPLVNMVDANGTGTITDNEAPGAGISVTGFNVTEAVGTAAFTITYNGPTVEDAFDVAFAVTDGSATDPEDYSVNTTIVSFPTNTTDGSTQEVVITIVDDNLNENSEDLNIQLNNTSNVLVPVGTPDTAIGIITDNDMPGPNDGLYIDDLQVDEDAGTATITVRLQGAFGAFAVDYATNDGAGSATATAGGVDYNETNGTLSFAEGQASATFEVVIVDDCLIEGNEFFLADLINAPDYVPVRDGNASITIIDNEMPITASDFEPEITIVCGEEVPEVPQLTFTGGSGEITVDFTEEVQASAAGTDDFLIVRTWNVSDACGNTATFEQIIVVLQPTLEEVFLDICVEDEALDLVNFLPESFDANGVFESDVQGTFLNGTFFTPAGLEEGEYLVRYSSTEGTCKYFVDFFVTVNRDCVECDVDANIIISKTVTANGDNINDVFSITGLEYCDYVFDVKIFNRWGAMVYEQQDYQNNWGGTSPDNAVGSNGTLPAGTYYYLVDAISPSGQVKKINGFIYLGADQ